MTGLSALFLSGMLTYGIWALGLATLAGALGVPVPTSMLVIAAGALARQGVLDWQWAVALAVLGAIAGDSVSYLMGRFGARLAPQRVQCNGAWRRAQTTFERWGGLAVFLSRFLLLPLALPINLMAGRRRDLVRLDEYLHGIWQAIPYERAIVIWPVDGAARLREYQVIRGEKPGLDVVNTAILTNDAPRARFRRKYGFDPLALVDRMRFRGPVQPEFVIGQQSSPDDMRGLALIHECIAERAGVPVVAFDPLRPLRTLPSKAAPPAPASPR